MYPPKRKVSFVANHLPIIAITNLTKLKEKTLCSSSVLSFAAVSVERGGESRGCLSSELNASFAIVAARKSSINEE